MYSKTIEFFVPKVSAAEIIDGDGTGVGTGVFSQNTHVFQNAITTNPTADTINEIINKAIPLLLTSAGLILFGMLIWGGFTMLTAVSDPKKAEAGKARITAAIIGFLIIFGSYWITQILEIILGVKILN